MKNKFYKLLLFILIIFPITVYADNPVINGNNFTVFNRTKEEIYNEWLTGKIDSSVTKYISEPSYTAPYKAGVVTDEYLAEVVENLNYYRYLIGVPLIEESTTNDEELQTAEVIQTLFVIKNRSLTHDLVNDFPKPDDMEQSFYDLGSDPNHNIISYGRVDEPNFFFFDESIFDEGYPENGHRMDLLTPEIIKEDYGIGQTTIYGRNTVNRNNYDNMTNAFAAYPSPGYFPKQDFADISDWDVFLNIDEFGFLTTEEQQNVVVTIKNLTTNEVFTRTKADNNLYFDYECYGTLCTIHNRMSILQPTRDTTYYEDSYEVAITNLKDRQGNYVDIKYTVNFFDKNEFAELNILDAAYELDLDTIIYDGDYDRNLLDNALDGLGINLSLEENNQYTYRPSSFEITSYEAGIYHATPNIDDLPKQFKDPNHILDNNYLTIYGFNNQIDYRFGYNQLSYVHDEGENTTISLTDFNADFDGQVLYLWVKEKDGVFSELTDESKYSTDGLNLNINNLTAEDSGNYYLTALLMSDEYMSIYYLSKPLNLQVKKNYLDGDLNKNDKIDLPDVIKILKFYLDLDEPTTEDIEIGDMNDNGNIDLPDVIALLRLYLGIN